VIVTDLAGSMGKLLAMWMDRDPQSRRSSIETYLAPDVEFRSPFGQARGYDELEKYSDYLQGKFPGTGFFVDGPVQLIGDYVRSRSSLKNTMAPLWRRARISSGSPPTEEPN
jgi:hypothetical protein